MRQQLLPREPSLLDDALDSAGEASTVLLAEILRGDHDDRGRGAPLQVSVAQYELEPVHHGHHQVQQDDPRPLFGYAIQGVGAVCRLGHGPSITLQRATKQGSFAYE